MYKENVWSYHKKNTTFMYEAYLLGKISRYTYITYCIKHSIYCFINRKKINRALKSRTI